MKVLSVKLDTTPYLSTEQIIMGNQLPHICGKSSEYRLLWILPERQFQ